MTGETETTVAAVDLGSNSFHLLIAQWNGRRLRIVDKTKEMVRLAGGLDGDRKIDEAAQQRAVAALQRFGERIRGMDPSYVRAVGTNTLRAASNAREFLARGEDGLGHRIEVIAGVEEARLIYLGAAHSVQPVAGLQIVVDIGGGSTECVLGEGFESIECHSLRMGCVTFTSKYFPDGKIDLPRFRAAELAAAGELRSIEARFGEVEWRRALGSSGTIRAVEDVLLAQGWSERGVNRAGLDELRTTLLKAGRVEKLELPGLSERRRPVFAGGVAILSAVFERLGVDQMDVSQGALKEGVVRDLVGRFEGHDLRDETVREMQERYQVDTEQAGRVAGRFERLLEQVRQDWDLGDPHWLKVGGWAAALHEIGLTMSYSGHHRHGAYILQNTPMPGFSRDGQRLLAALVLNYRRRFRYEDLRRLAGDDSLQALRVTALLRLAARLERGRGRTAAPELSLRAKGDVLQVAVPGPPDAAPLLWADLESEKKRFKRADLKLKLQAADP